MTTERKKVVACQWTRAEDDMLYDLLAASTDLSRVPLRAQWTRIQSVMHWRSVDSMRVRWRRIQCLYVPKQLSYRARLEASRAAHDAKCAKAGRPVDKEMSFLALDAYVLWREPSAIEIGDFSWLSPLLELHPRGA